MALSKIGVNLPSRAEKGQALSAQWLNSLRESVGRLAMRQNPSGQVDASATLPPFTVALEVTEGTPATYSVYVSPGYVIERDLCKGEAVDAMIYHDVHMIPGEPGSIIDADGFPVEFPIEVGEAVFVLVREGTAGHIDGGTDPDTEVLVDLATTGSTNYIPDTQDGKYYYKLAELVDSPDFPGFPELKLFAAGSHIYHTSGLTCDVRIMGCDPDPLHEGDGYDPPQLMRISFLSGRVVSLDETVAARPLATAQSDCNVSSCT